MGGDRREGRGQEGRGGDGREEKGSGHPQIFIWIVAYGT